MPKRLRIGLAGAGYASRFHVENFRETGVDVVGVTSPRPESRQAFAGRYGVRAYASVAEMLPEIDVLDICSPPSSHRDYILQAAAAGKHIIVEKPLTGFYGSPEKHSKHEMLEVVAEEARQMREHVARAGVVVGYAENCVYAPAVQKEREVVEKSKAMILRLTAEESHSGSHSPVYGIWAEQGGGSLIGKGCHPLGAVLYLKRKEGLARLGAAHPPGGGDLPYPFHHTPARL